MRSVPSWANSGDTISRMDAEIKRTTERLIVMVQKLGSEVGFDKWVITSTCKVEITYHKSSEANTRDAGKSKKPHGKAKKGP